MANILGRSLWLVTSIILLAPPLMAQDLSAPKKLLEVKSDNMRSGGPIQRTLEPKYGTVDSYSDSSTSKSWSVSPLKLTGNVEEQNLSIEWNEWHNRFSRSVRNHMFTSIYETLNFPRGLLTVYSCTVGPDKHIKSAKIVKSSGNIWYDSAVMKSINRLDGNEILAFPPQSQRSEIVTEVGVRFGAGHKGDLDFGDVEYRELSPGELPQLRQENSDSLKTKL